MTCGRRNYLRIRDLWLRDALVCAPYGSFLVAARELDAQLFQFAIKMRALEPHTVGYAAHVAAFLTDVMLKVNAFECVARLAQRQIERQRRGRGRRRRSVRRQRLTDFVDADLLRRRSQCKRTHD